MQATLTQSRTTAVVPLHSLRWAVLALCLLSLAAVSLAFGSADIPLPAVWDILTGRAHASYPPAWAEIVWQLRLPRTATTVLAGSSLSVAGLLLQTWFRNPLAGPSSLGITSGASLGVAAVVLTGGGSLTAGTLRGLGLTGGAVLIAAAAGGAMLMLLLMLAVSSRLRQPATLLIAGLMVANLSFGLVGAWQYFSTPDQLQEFLLWSFGSLGGVPRLQLLPFAVACVVGWALALACVKPLNLLLLGPAYAESSGVHLGRVRFCILLATALLAGTVTAFCGPIAFVGLAVPHLARGVFRSNDHRILLPACALLGAAMLLACDALSLLTGGYLRLPINIVTALVGAPVVLAVLLRLKTLSSDSQ